MSIIQSKYSPRYLLFLAYNPDVISFDLDQWQSIEIIPPAPQAVEGSCEEINRFIRIRIDHENEFNDRLYSKREVWQRIADEVEINANWRKLKKKWSNLLYQYKKIRSSINIDNGRPESITWPFYDIIHKYEMQKVNAITDDLYTGHEIFDNSNSEDVEPEIGVKDPKQNEMRTYKRSATTNIIKSPSPKKPLLRINHSIFKTEPTDLDETDPVVTFKIEDECDTELYEIITTPVHDYPSDPVEYEPYEEIEKPTTPPPDDYSTESPLHSPNMVKATVTIETNCNEKHTNEKSANSGKKSPAIGDTHSPKKRQKCFIEVGETTGEKKLRREIMKCANVFLKFMKRTYDLDPDPINSDSDSE